MRSFLKHRPKPLRPDLTHITLVSLFLMLLLFLIKFLMPQSSLLTVAGGPKIPVALTKAIGNESSTLRVDVGENYVAIAGEPLLLDSQGNPLKGKEKQDELIAHFIRLRQLYPDRDELLLIASEDLPFSELAPVIQAGLQAGLTRWNIASVGAP